MFTGAGGGGAVLAAALLPDGAWMRPERTGQSCREGQVLLYGAGDLAGHHCLWAGLQGATGSADPDGRFGSDAQDVGVTLTLQRSWQRERSPVPAVSARSCCAAAGQNGCLPQKRQVKRADGL